MAAYTIILDDLQRVLLCPNGVRDISERKGRYVVDVLGDQGMGKAITAGRPFLVRAVVPALINCVHYMTVVAGCGIIP